VSTEHSLAFRVRAVLSQQRDPCTDFKSVQQYTTIGAVPTIRPSYIRVRAVVWSCGHGQTHRHTDRRARPLYISRRLYDSREM